MNGQLVGAAANWVRGEEMSIDKLVGANRVDGKTQISVINLSHITDFEDQSFVVPRSPLRSTPGMENRVVLPEETDRTFCSFG